MNETEEMRQTLRDVYRLLDSVASELSEREGCMDAANDLAEAAEKIRAVIAKATHQVVREDRLTARLIAAAPELLEACRAVSDAWSRTMLSDAVDKARAAIAKATQGQVPEEQKTAK